MCVNQIINFVVHSELVGILLSAFILYLLGIRAHRKQKSIEECRKKYVEEGLEALYDELDAAYTSFSLNRRRAHQLLRFMRDWTPDTITIDAGSLEHWFNSYIPKNLGLGRRYKFVELFGDDTLWKWSLDFFDELMTHQGVYFEQDFVLNFKRFTNTPNKDTELCKEAYVRHHEKLKEIEQKINKKFIPLGHYLGQIINTVRRKQISYEKMSKLKEDRDIKDLLKTIRTEFQKIQDEEQESSAS